MVKRLKGESYKMKMYILVLDDVPKDLVPVICAHASLACYLNKYEDSEKIHDNFDIWLKESFKKVVCEVNEKEWNQAIDKEVDYQFITESSLENREVAIAFTPREDYHKCFKFFRKWKAN